MVAVYQYWTISQLLRWISPQSIWLLNSSYWDIPHHSQYTESNMTFTREFQSDLVYTSLWECVTHWALLKVPLKSPLTVQLKHCHKETNVRYIKKHVKKNNMTKDYRAGRYTLPGAWFVVITVTLERWHIYHDRGRTLKATFRGFSVDQS